MNDMEKSPPQYAIQSVDHALRLAAMLQVEGTLTVSDAADHLGVARSTAHRLLAMLVYRNFATKNDRNAYQPGRVLELAEHSPSRASQLRSAAFPHMRRVVERIGESTNLSVRTGHVTRFVGGVESHQALRVSSRDGMVFPAHQTTTGLLTLAELSSEELEELYAADKYVERPDERPDLRRLRAELTRVRRNGFAVNFARSERGVFAIGVGVRDGNGRTVAGLSLSMPHLRYRKEQLPEYVTAVRAATQAMSQDLAGKI